MTLQSRGFHANQDVEALHGLIVDCWRAYGPAVTFHVGDLHWRLRPQLGRSPERDLRLWYKKEKLRAFAWFDPPDSGDILCHPEIARDAVEPALLEWLEGKACARGASHFTVGAFQSDRIRENLLIARGYRKQVSFIHHMQRLLESPVAGTAVKGGYSVGNPTTADLSSLSITISCAFQSEPKPVSAYEALRASRFYRNDLDIVVKSKSGEVVAFCLAWLDEQNKVGLLEPVGCHPEHRRLGLAAAAVDAALERLRSIGAHTAVVYPTGDNPAACGLYKKCSFMPIANDYDWTIAL